MDEIVIKMNKKQKEKPKNFGEWLKANWLKILCIIITVVWLIAMYFPIYWLLISSTKDSAEAQRNPPKLWFVLPQTYTIYLDSTNVEGYNEEEFTYEAAVVAWMVADRSLDINLNGVKIAWCEDGKVRQTLHLKYSVFKTNKYDGLFAGSVSQARIQRWREKSDYRYTKLLSYFNKDVVNQSIPRSFSTEKRSLELDGYINRVTDPKEQTITDNERITIQSKYKGITAKSDFSGLFNNFVSAWNYSNEVDYSFGRFILNTIFISVVSIAFVLVVNSLAAYAFSALIKNDKIKGFIMTAFLITITIPGIVKQVPLYAMIKNSALNDTYWALWLPGAFSPVYILLMKAYFDQIPKDLLDAAKIDGANNIYIFAKMVVPLSLPVFGAIAIMSFTGSWNDFFWPNLVLESTEKFNFTQIIQQAMSIETGGVRDYSVALAMSVIACLPTLPIYAFMQKQLKEGLMLGSLKG